MPEGAETLLAFDFGTRQIGVALGNTITGAARPLTLIASEPLRQRFARIEALLKEWQPDRLVVGLPLAADGGEQEITRRSRRFANQLHGRFRLPVELQDERGSSIEAQQSMPRNGADDAWAAAVILQRYLDHTSGHT